MGLLTRLKEKFTKKDSISGVVRSLTSDLQERLSAFAETDKAKSIISNFSPTMKYIYSFHEGSKDMKDLLGGKGAGLAEMIRLNLPVPAGFTITTETCNYFLETNSYPEGFHNELAEHLAEIESAMGKGFGDANNPLLFSVRSGAKISMPGMMDTVLNLGLNDTTIQGLINQTNNPRFAYDSYRRFIQMFGDVVLKVEHEKFEHALNALKEARGVKLDTELTAEDFKTLITEYKKIVREATGEAFPDEPMKQLSKAIEAVFSSWNNNRAITYRKLNKIPDYIGTAVTVQSMVFGNKGNTSGTGVAFTRNPSTGEKAFYGEFLMNAQGEDVVAGIRTPQEISSLRDVMPAVYDELVTIKDKLEAHYRDMQDIEFTIEEGKLYFLQTRTGKRTAASGMKIAVDMVGEGLISKEEAVLRQNTGTIDTLLHPSIDHSKKGKVLARGLPASPGAACGVVVFTAEDAVEFVQNRDTKVLLVR